MKIKVSYRKTVEEEIEVDDKYFALTDSGGFENLPPKESDDLINGIIIEVETHTEANFHDICYIESADGEIMFEG